MNIKSIYYSKNLLWNYNGVDTPLKDLTLVQLKNVQKKLRLCSKHNQLEFNGRPVVEWKKIVRKVIKDKILNVFIDTLFRKFGEAGAPFLLRTLRNPDNYSEETVAREFKKKQSEWSVSNKGLETKSPNYVNIPGDYIDRAKVIKELKENKTQPVKVFSSDLLKEVTKEYKEYTPKTTSEVDKIIKESKRLRFVNMD
jgi:hypothetical protein